MKKLKNIIIYGAIILLLAASLIGYTIQNNQEKQPAVKADTGNVQNTPQNTPENTPVNTSVSTPQNSAAASPATEEIPRNAAMLKDGNDITGKSEEEKQAHIKELMDQARVIPDQNPVVGIGRGDDYSKVTSEAIDNAGGLKDIIQKGDIVLIKPNICMSYLNAGMPQITDYRVVQEVVDTVLEYGAARVIVAEGAFYGNVFDFEKNMFCTLEGVELFNFNSCEEEDCYELEPENSLVGKAIYVPKIYMDADVVINIAKLKTHFLTMASLSLKNVIGVPSERIYGTGADKSGLHALGIDDVIVDLNHIRRPDFAIIDGIVGGEGNGPVSNKPVQSNIVFAGKDLVALDTVAATFMGRDPRYITHLQLASMEGLGIKDLDKITVVGADLDAIKMQFK